MSHNVLVAIDARRNLNNGHPSFLAWLIEQLDLNDGQSVYHVGAGTGYYSAILASMVGEAGRVIAIEVDDALARRARQNLLGYRQVEVVGGDGFSHNPGPVDAILVNAGVNPQGDAQRPELARRIHRSSGYLPVHWGTQQARRDPSEAGFCERRSRKGALAAVG